MNQSYFIGVDVSKEKLDVGVITASNEIVLEKIILNKPTKIKLFLAQLVRKLKTSNSQLLICCEHSGVYAKHLESICLELGYPLWMENPYKIKKASFDIRGKFDKKDALRIANYALRYRDKAVLSKSTSPEQNQLRALLGARETLLLQLNTLRQQLSETKDYDPRCHEVLKSCYSKLLRSIKKELDAIEERLDQVISSDAKIQQNVMLLKSIPGIGRQNALNFVIFTDNFTRFNSGKHLACYAGVVPFPNQSGTMIKRDRVSSFANKKLKKLLHLAAMAAVKVHGELRAYYLRKVAEGKNKMSVLNAVRNKLVQRMFAVVQRQSQYVIIQR